MIRKDEEMKKVSIIAIVISIGFSIFGCTINKQRDQETSSSLVSKQEDNLESTQETFEKENNNDKSLESKNQGVIANKTGRKDYYLEKLNDIQAKIDKDYNFKDTNTTYEMRNVSGAQYRMWDDELNEIYNELRKALPSAQMEKLKEEEIKWISQKESDAKNAADQVKGGTLEPVNYSLSLADSTKKRCYELVNNYFK
ncbi:uncharacterized protein YecT (DUF1311 family) [Clostridium saccharoperbutylacetonicum]|uniref:Lysozyme inhibitor LprI-like N-terminal domain-containing protein n=1 Tax=Clostridium saccharoperbutylacetonicum N1-4(HMT) TaxID=931276 RepID=M1N1Q3_9CLOT|nr:lysozyme inhibitor LprI family protein [Clostridium saccharoperbutylacetonicum]AGF57417.1 hypothetical protein Cspa_c36570 [Clostridium saccharoperbutylacetonicum N1-4(HMT)]NRT61818.1 uncharacterized protein YecT (DUF1311 family) [Clostridium saccharoperbutylacetonicum]NSB25144.1 uncharacterized protein YecT (DUF1311 family) [Clostridium saccharoperbutylacetonicum]NSB44514.1 uncharacterized protein YecT (DUF1311 family) [Clostridium saccharoperbutylacetonicum]